MNILLADDHALFRESLSLALLRLDEQPPRILQAGHGQQALDIAKKEQLDLILLDVDMPGLGGIQAIAQLHTLHPDTPIVMISAHEDTPSINQALAEGAKGFIPKTTSADVTLSALRLVLSGGTFLPPQLMQHVMLDASQAHNESLLTPRQIEVLRLLQKGTQNKNIAFELDLSPSTVKVHIRRIFTSLGARNRTEAVNIAVEKGIL
ncbi:response regulator transcription factor [bacterium AH-315-I20]|nr:response regulator transcription factor [bacterium AH-315-I20]